MFSKKQIAQILNVSVRTVERLIQDKKIIATKLPSGAIRINITQAFFRKMHISIKKTKQMLNV
jgi:excisionase family DNA binding protein